MDGLINQLTHLQPTDMSVVMLVVALVDMWAAVSLSIKARSTLSKSLIYGAINNLLIISIPWGLSVLTSLTTTTKTDNAYVNTVSVMVTLLYIASAVTSIVANYSAAYPQGKNWLTKIAYKYIPTEVENKQNKHGIMVDDNTDVRG